MNGKRRETFILASATIGIALVLTSAAWGISATPSDSALTVTIGSSSPSREEPQPNAAVSSAAASDEATTAPNLSAPNSKASESAAPSSSSASSDSAAMPSRDADQASSAEDDGFRPIEDNRYVQETGAEQPQSNEEYYVPEGNQDVPTVVTENTKTGKQQTNRKSESSSNKQAQSSAQPERSKVWVEPVYKDVYHEEKGHWETRTREVKKVICGGTDHNPGDPNYDGPFGGPSPIFDDYDGWKAHQDAFIREMRKDDPYYQCTGRHRPAREITEQEEYKEYVIDQAAWTEQVLVSEGHWEYR